MAMTTFDLLAEPALVKKARATSSQAMQVSALSAPIHAQPG